jgi:non-specific serine/threonine protein kinase/serine/threonine-protein kinase
MDATGGWFKNVDPSSSEPVGEPSDRPDLQAASTVARDFAEPATTPAPSAEPEAKFRSIGVYRLQRRLGEGGMGEVWLAEQTAPMRRMVALKLMKMLRCDLMLLERFQAERQSLAIMDHPTIAKAFDAGATAAGQPYFVMEYVPGQAITDYCDQKHLEIRQRLELFMKVCDGVQHAHQKAIIHRDLKPANILVVEVDRKPAPRIIDFGLSKTVSPLAAHEMITRVGDFVGTPGYMSPEQADPTVADVDTRTDVYSLGAILYVLLAGTLPFETKSRRKQQFHEMLQQLREDDPPSPSTKVVEDRESATAKAEMRGTEPKQLVHLLRGDLDWITLKALERDRNRRYGAPSELAADLHRYLRHEPVVARPASTGYRLGKYLRRNRVGVAVTAGLVILLAAFAVTFSLAQAAQIRRITRERDRADRIASFMTGMFRVSDSNQAKGNAVTARELLDKASKEINTGLARDPERQSQMMDVMGTVYANLGLYARAQPLLERSVGIRTRLLGLRNPETLRSRNHLGWTLYNEGRSTEAEKLDRETLDLQRQLLGAAHPDTLMSMSNLAGILKELGRFSEAEKLQRETLDMRRRVLGDQHPDTLMSMSNLAGVLQEQGRYAEAERFDRATLDIQRQVLGPEHTDTLKAMGGLAIDLANQGHYAEAEKLDRETLEGRRRVLGPEHRETLSAMNNLATTLLMEGRYADAEKLQRETIDIQQRVFGLEHRDTLAAMTNLATVLMKEGHYGGAETVYRQTLDIQRRVLGKTHPDVAGTLYNLGCLMGRQGRKDEAFTWLRDAIDSSLDSDTDMAIENDTDLKSLHADPRFDSLVAYAKKHALTAQVPK